nr:hypothetical protein [Tessaracoccus coleopterorum]
MIVSHLALGATTRLIAPLLRDKKTDPGVVVIDEAGRFAVPLVGGHAGGANDLARRIADGLGATPVLTTATDALDLPALDTLGWAYTGDVAGVTRALINGTPCGSSRSTPGRCPAARERVRRRRRRGCADRRHRPRERVGVGATDGGAAPQEPRGRHGLQPRHPLRDAARAAHRDAGRARPGPRIRDGDHHRRPQGR